MAKNLEVLLAAADYIESHPDEYNYGWGQCVAAHIARQAGQTLDGAFVVADGLSTSDRHVSNWSLAYLGLGDNYLHDEHYLDLFIHMGGVNKDDAKAVANFVRQRVRELE